MLNIVYESISFVTGLLKNFQVLVDKENLNRGWRDKVRLEKCF